MQPPIPTVPANIRRRVTARKHGGDDAYSWAVFVDGQLRSALTGLSRRQATYYVNQLRQSLMERSA